jgi:hypothetical protein
MIFAIVLGAVLVVFGAIALRLDLKDRRFIRGNGRRGSVSQRAVRQAEWAAQADASRRGVSPSQLQPPSAGGF